MPDTPGSRIDQLEKELAVVQAQYKLVRNFVFMVIFPIALLLIPIVGTLINWGTASVVDRHTRDAWQKIVLNSGDHRLLLRKMCDMHIESAKLLGEIRKRKDLAYTFNGDVTIKGNLLIEPGYDSENMIAKLRVGTDDKNIEIFSRSKSPDSIMFTRNFGKKRRTMLKLEDKWNPEESRKDLNN